MFQTSAGNSNHKVAGPGKIEDPLRTISLTSSDVSDDENDDDSITKEHAPTGFEAEELITSQELQKDGLSKSKHNDLAVFKVPAPIHSIPDDKQNEKLLNAFPALNGPQRAITTNSLSAPQTQLQPRRKVVLAPGHSPLDWARLLTSGVDLRAGITQLQRFTPEDLKAHRKRDDMWMSINGKVYNVTPYVDFHPGGAGQLLRGAGKDATELFMKVHPWVNIDSQLGKCHIGFLLKGIALESK